MPPPGRPALTVKIPSAVVGSAASSAGASAAGGTGISAGPWEPEEHAVTRARAHNAAAEREILAMAERETEKV